MSRIQGFVSPLEGKTIKEIVGLIKEKYPGLTQEAIAVSIGYDRTVLSKKDVRGESQIKALLIYRYLLNKTSPASTDTRDGKKLEAIENDVNSSAVNLGELSEHNRIVLAQLEMLSTQVLQLKDQISNIERAVSSDGGKRNKASVQQDK